MTTPGRQARIPLCRGGIPIAFALVDPGDFEWLTRWTWYLVGRYAARHVHDAGKKRVILMHRAILGLKSTPGERDTRQVDHINRDRLDNRRSNLRLATAASNAQNLKLSPKNKSGYRGVYRAKGRRKWNASVKLNGVNHILGAYDDPKDAAEVAARFRAEHMPYSIEAGSQA